MSRELGENLKRIRKSAGFTQKQIADRLNVDRSTYSNYERSVTEPDITTLIKLSKILDVSLDDLLTGGQKALNVAEPETIPVYTLSRKEQELLIGYRLLKENEKGQAFDFIDDILESQE